MDIWQKTFRITIVVCLTSFGLLNQSIAQNHEKPASMTMREIERGKLNTVVPQSFDYKGRFSPVNNTGQDTSIVQTVHPASFASEIIITVRDQIRREQQNSDETIVARQKAMIEGIKREK